MGAVGWEPIREAAIRASDDDERAIGTATPQVRLEFSRERWIRARSALDARWIRARFSLDPCKVRAGPALEPREIADDPRWTHVICALGRGAIIKGRITRRQGSAPLSTHAPDEGKNGRRWTP